MTHWSVEKKLVDETEEAAWLWVAPHVKATACEYDDQHCNTDLVVKGARISLRARWVDHQQDGSDQFDRYWHQFTIRSSRPATGFPTEVDKIRAGHGDLFFYYWVENATKRIVCGTLIDLHVFRPLIDKILFCDQDNADRAGHRDSSFRAYSLEAAANRGCVIEHRYADASALTWARRQMIRLVNANKPEAA